MQRKSKLTKIAFCQYNVSFSNPEKNYLIVETLLQDISADIIVLPELFNSGYFFVNKNEVEALAEKMGGETVRFLKGLSKKKNCFIYGGYPEKADEGIYNSSAFIGYDGTEIYYRKAHLFFEEKKFFLPGNSPLKSHAIKLKNGNTVKVGLMICFDWFFPETARTLALDGAQILLHCANLVMPYCPDAMVTRCLENRVFSVTCNRIGSEVRECKSLTYIGRSRIISPAGEVLGEADSFNNKVCVVEIDASIAENKQLNPMNNLFEDRRTDLYRL